MKLQLHNISVEPSTINSTNSNPLKFGLNKSNLHQLQADTVEISSNSKNNQLAFRGSKNIKIKYNEDATEKLGRLLTRRGYEYTVPSDAIEELAKKGADVRKYAEDILDNFLEYQYEYDSMVKTLVSRGFDVNTPGYHNNETLLHRATAYGLRDTIRALLRCGANPNQESWYGTAFNYDDDNVLKYEWKIFTAEKEARAKATNDLVKELNRDTFDINSLKKAIKLVKGDVDIDIKNKHGDTLLHKLAQYVNDPKFLKIVLDKNPDTDIQNKNGNTPLHLAAQNHNKETIKILLDYGADPSIKNKSKETFIDSIYSNFKINEAQKETNINIDFSKLEKEEKATKDLTEMLAIMGNNKIDKKTFDKITKLIDKGADSNTRNRHTWTALHFVSKTCDSPEMIETLVKKGASINIQKNDGWTPLHLAINNRRYKTAKKLLELGADPNIRNEDNVDAICILVEYADEDDKEVLDMLDVFKKYNANFDKALDKLALFYGKRKLARKLIELGANVDNVNRSGYRCTISYEELNKMDEEIKAEKNKKK